MPCFTVVRVTLDDDAITRKARKALGYPATGDLLQTDAAVAKARIKYGIRYGNVNQVTNAAARAVVAESKMLTAIAKVRKLQPTAMVTRKGVKIIVRVTV